MSVLRRVLAPSPRVHPVGVAERDEVVDHRRAQSASLARVHPVGEVEDVERPGETLHRRPADAAPERSPEVCRRRQRNEAPFDRDTVERVLQPPARAHAHRREGDDLVLVRRPPRRARAASRGCSSRPRSAGARAARRRRRCAWGDLRLLHWQPVTRLRRSLPLPRPVPESFPARAAREVPRLGARARVDADQPDHADGRLLADLLRASPRRHASTTTRSSCSPAWSLGLLPGRAPDVVHEPARPGEPREAGALSAAAAAVLGRRRRTS